MGALYEGPSARRFFDVRLFGGLFRRLFSGSGSPGGFAVLRLLAGVVVAVLVLFFLGLFAMTILLILLNRLVN